MAESGIIHRVTVEFKSDKVAYDIDNWSWCKHYVSTGKYTPGETKAGLKAMLTAMRHRLAPVTKSECGDQVIKQAVTGFMEMIHLVGTYDYDNKEVGKRVYNHYDDVSGLTVTIEVESQPA